MGRLTLLSEEPRKRKKKGESIEDSKLLRRGSARERKERMCEPPFPPLRSATGGDRA